MPEDFNSPMIAWVENVHLALKGNRALLISSDIGRCPG